MNMREKYRSLALVDLKAIAKSRGIKGTSSMKKADVIEAMVALDEAEGGAAPAGETADAGAGDRKDSGKETPQEAKASGNAPAEAHGEQTEQTEHSRKGADADKKEAAAPARTENGRSRGRGQVIYTAGNVRQGEGVAERYPSYRNNSGTGRNQERRPVRRYNQGQTDRNAGENRNYSENRSFTENRGAEGRSYAESRSAEGRSYAENRSTEGRSYGENRSAEGRSHSENRDAEGRSFTENRNGGERREMESREHSAAEKRFFSDRGTADVETAGQEQTFRQNGSAQPALVGNEEEKYPAELDSGITANGILEVMPDDYGFIRCANYLPGENDVYVAPSQIRRFGLKTGDIVVGNTRIKTQNEKFSALLYVKTINGYTPEVAVKRCNFGDMTPIFPDERIRLEQSRSSVAMRIMDLMSPVGKGQRGMIVSPPKAGKTTLLKQVAQSVKTNHPDMHLIILLIDERPEEVTDFREAIEGHNVEVIYSTFDELPENHKRVSEMVIERAKRLVEHKQDVMILLDSITRLTRAYNLVIPPSGRTLSGGLDPAALHMPKRFFGAARNMRGGGSLTILASALVDTGSKMDDVIYEEFKGTGNMEIVLDRKLSEKRVFPAIDIPKSGTRRDDLLLTAEEQEAMTILRKGLNGLKPDESVDKILDMFARTKSNAEFVNMVRKIKFV